MAISVEEKICGYLQKKIPAAKNMSLTDFTHTAGGWSHEIYLFTAHWQENGQSVQRPLCLRKDPGAGLLREFSNLEEQFRVIKALEPTPTPTPRAYWYEPSSELLGGPFFVMEKVPGEVPNPWSRAGKQVYAEAAERGKLPKSFTEALASLHNQELTGLTVDLDACRYYDLLYAMRSTAFWLSASGLFAEGKNKDLRLARTAYSVPVVLDMAAKALGF